MPEVDNRTFPVALDGESAEIGCAADLAVALDVLNGRRDRVLLEQLRPDLSNIVRTAADLAILMRALAKDDQLFLIAHLAGALPDILKDAARLRELLAFASEPEVKRKIIETLGADGLRALIVSARDLAGALEWVYGPIGGRMVELVGADFLKRHLRHGEDLALVFNSLSDAAQTQLIESIGFPFVVALIRTARDLALLLHAAPPDIARALIRHFSRAQLIEIIGDRASWRYLHARIRPDEAAELLQRLDAPHAL